MKLHSAAADRNVEPICSVLAGILPREGLVLEVASGSGQHVIAFARAFPGLMWQPSDRDEAARVSIEARRLEAELPNIRAPIEIDVTAERWAIEDGHPRVASRSKSELESNSKSNSKSEPELKAQALVNINMIHIAPWSACEGLFRGAERLLTSGSPLYLYGPFVIDGAHTAESNREFDHGLRARNPEWGVRDLRDVERVAQSRGFGLVNLVPMPANNFSVIFRRQ